MQVVEEHIAKAVIGVIQIPRLGPEGHWNTGEFQPINQGPQDQILEEQEQDDGIWIDALDLRSITGKLERTLDEFELALILVLLLQFVGQDDKVPPVLPETPPEVVVDRHTIVHEPVGN